MTITQAMRDFVNRRANDDQDEVEEDFFDSFYTAEEEDFITLWESRELLQPATPRRDQRPNNAPRRNNAPKINPDHITAPFRFVSLNETIAMPEDCIQAAWKAETLHSEPMAEGMSGVFDIKITFDGPVLVGGSQNDQPQTLGGEYVLPATTLRGLTRSVVETAAFGRLVQTNLHHRYGIRDFGHELFKDDARKETKAGWLRRWREGDPETDSGYVIEPCETGLIKIRDLDGTQSDNADWHHGWLTKNMPQRYAKFGMRQGNTFDFTVTNTFSRADDGGYKSDPDGQVSGILVFSDRSPAFSGKGLGDDEQITLRDRGTDQTTKMSLQKKALDIQDSGQIKGASKRRESVFFESDQTPIAIPKKIWDTFTRNNSKPSDHKPKPDGNWAILKPTLDAGNRIPIFWVGNDTHVKDLGLVRVFKRAHSYTVKDVLKQSSPDHLIDPDNITPDFTDALFGYVHEPEDHRKSQQKEERQSQAGAHLERHLKGRVGFGYAYLDENTPAKTTDTIKTVMSAPKASFGPFYLTGGKADWSDPAARLAGRKRYPVRGANQRAVTDWLVEQKGNGNADLFSKLKFLVPQDNSKPLIFNAKIRVHNITLAELGALVWALTWGGDSSKRHLIGRAKTAGAGQARIEVSGLGGVRRHMDDTSPDQEQALAAFAAHMVMQVPGWPNVDIIKELLNSADPAYGKNLKLEYLSLQDHGKLRKAMYGNVGHARLLGLK